MDNQVIEFGSEEMGGGITFVSGSIVGQEGAVVSAFAEKTIGDEEDTIELTDFSLDSTKLLLPGEISEEMELKIKENRTFHVLKSFFGKLVSEILLTGSKKTRMLVPMLPSMSEEVCRRLQASITNVDQVVPNFRSRILTFICE